MKSLKVLLHTTALVWCLLNNGEATKFNHTPHWKVNQVCDHSINVCVDCIISNY